MTIETDLTYLREQGEPFVSHADVVGGRTFELVPNKLASRRYTVPFPTDTNSTDAVIVELAAVVLAGEQAGA